MSVEVVGGKVFNWKPRVERFRRLAIRRLVRKEGYSEASATEMVGKIGDGKILDWILEHQDEIVAVLKFVAMLISMFAMTPNPEDEPATLAAIEA